MRVYIHSYWQVIFCTTNSSRGLAKEMWKTFENSWKKTQYLLNTLYKLWRDIDCSLNREIASPRYGAIHVRLCYLSSQLFSHYQFSIRARARIPRRDIYHLYQAPPSFLLFFCWYSLFFFICNCIGCKFQLMLPLCNNGERKVLPSVP